jgi:hypothetical protein
MKGSGQWPVISGQWLDFDKLPLASH